MADTVRRVMRQRAQRECVLVDILRLTYQVRHEIPAARVVDQVAEKPASEGVIPHVLDDAASIGIGAGAQELVRRSLRKALYQQRPDGIVPGRIDDGLVRQHGVAVQ